MPTYGDLGKPDAQISIEGTPPISRTEGAMIGIRESLAKTPEVYIGNKIKQKIIENTNVGAPMTFQEIKEQYPDVASQFPQGGHKNEVIFAANKLDSENYRQTMLNAMPEGMLSTGIKWGSMVVGSLSPTNIILLCVTLVIIKKIIKIVKPLFRKNEKNLHGQEVNQSDETFKKVVKMKKHCLVFGNLFIWICALLNCLVCGQNIIGMSEIYLIYLLFLLGENVFLFILMNYFLMDRTNNKNFWPSLLNKSKLANSYSNLMKLTKIERITFILNVIYSLLIVLLLVLHLPDASWSDSSWSWHVENIGWIFKTQLFIVSATCLIGYAYKYFIDEKRQ
jgi:hypothetical protein